MAGLTIGKFAAAEGVGVETARFYQRRGLLALPEPRGSGYREHTEADMQKYGVLAVPTMHAFSGGQVVRQVTGARSKSALLRDFAAIIESRDPRRFRYNRLMTAGSAVGRAQNGFPAAA